MMNLMNHCVIIKVFQIFRTGFLQYLILTIKMQKFSNLKKNNTKQKQQNKSKRQKKEIIRR